LPIIGCLCFLVIFGGTPSNLDELLSFSIPIPTGLRHQAKGCEKRATLGENRE
jgi:hypothetical protein